MHRLISIGIKRFLCGLAVDRDFAVYCNLIARDGFLNGYLIRSGLGNIHDQLRLRRVQRFDYFTVNFYGGTFQKRFSIKRNGQSALAAAGAGSGGKNINGIIAVVGKQKIFAAVGNRCVQTLGNVAGRNGMILARR